MVEIQPEAAQLTATVGLFLMLATFGSLILLVQHISTMLPAPNIAAAAGAELLKVVLAEARLRSGATMTNLKPARVRRIPWWRRRATPLCGANRVHPKH